MRVLIPSDQGLPERWHVRGADLLITADQRHAKINSCGRYDSIRHIRHRIAWKGLPQIVKRRGQKTMFFFDEVNNFGQTDRGKSDLVTLDGSSVEKVFSGR